MYVNRRVQLAQCLIALWKKYVWLFLILCIYLRLFIHISISLFLSECPFQCPDILWFIVCAYTLLDRVYFSLSLWISVVVFRYIVTHCRCIFPTLDPYFSLSSSLNTSINVRLYCHWFYVNRYVSWSMFLGLFLSVCLSVSLYFR